jgi:hypothetical protein
MNNDQFDRQQREAVDNWKRDRAAMDRYQREQTYPREPASNGMKWTIGAVLALVIGVPTFAYVQHKVVEMNKPTTEQAVMTLCQTVNALRESRGLSPSRVC